MYQSQVTFTLDTICPWTYLAKKRLDDALKQVRASDAGQKVNFTLHFEPYQLNPDFPDSVDKNEWYLANKHMGNADAQRLFQAHMTDLLAPAGVALNFGGLMGNTLHAHRVIQHFQDAEHDGGSARTNRLVEALYAAYFARAQHPAADETLVAACAEAGIAEDEARRVVADKELGLRQVRDRLRMNGQDVDAVPVVMVEGKRRDLTLTGAKEVADYVKALETIVKESS
ncbi:hypothetical protein LMH87_000884 [Akanthomyces muscarius]|uniref:DSBA-like thioredoxin domain-containing protein n=1 Tax=Akanthomyces muscarius TaxID=2231603 RepID=A0A9W8QI87_AKAMU|nr:hypothetical protein LMH87_000884 [Akanthomyces muscarius]KAJ4155648.1 hypothetical protein LMH87_000884 [Akanthomyces muscarius]